MNKTLLHFEGFCVLVLSAMVYAMLDYSWLMFFLLLLTPDLSMLGYFINQMQGAVIYNIFHSYFIPFLVILIGIWISYSILLAVGLIWTAHIGMDRMIGYGLKYPTDFKDTHLQRV
ncbi:DUF4260 domain-containing protein [Salinibacillus xinjiangensis]|uniref:DUF4260 family protein n=1 Tax=Salinibacillus xinjiangensis TaxID=1229268 RepID=A0A6G1X5K9_9BACI|nr:DUF4260 domain-containing protein [Salinibacillus xinjiangensis]MRG86108.1 DUF4260 family protein [Salinibacillus xinjiangensis]